jgi:hypothetical protein
VLEEFAGPFRISVTAWPGWICAAAAAAAVLEEKV